MKNNKFEYLEIRYFESLEGIDENIVNLLNEKLKELKSKFEESLRIIHNRYELLEKQVNAYDKIDTSILARMDHCSADWFMMKIKIIETRPKELWSLIEKYFGKDYFKSIIQYEYGLNQKDMNAIFEEQQEQLETYKTKTLSKMARIWEESEQEIWRLRSELEDKNNKYALLETKYMKDVKSARVEAKEQVELQYKEFYDAKFHLFDIEKQDMYDQMRELRDKIRSLGVSEFDSDLDDHHDSAHNLTKDNTNPYTLEYGPSKSAMKMSKFKTAIHEKFEELAREKSEILSKNFELMKDNELLESEYQMSLFENQNLKQEIDSHKTDIKRLEANIKTFKHQIDELDKENDNLEHRLLKSALNKLSPEEIFRNKHRFEAAGIKFEGKAKISYEKFCK